MLQETEPFRWRIRREIHSGGSADVHYLAEYANDHLVSIWHSQNIAERPASERREGVRRTHECELAPDVGADIIGCNKIKTGSTENLADKSHPWGRRAPVRFTEDDSSGAAQVPNRSDRLEYTLEIDRTCKGTTFSKNFVDCIGAIDPVLQFQDDCLRTEAPSQPLDGNCRIGPLHSNNDHVSCGSFIQ